VSHGTLYRYIAQDKSGLRKGPMALRRGMKVGDANISLSERYYRWVTLRARWVTLRARWVTLRARWASRSLHPTHAHTGGHWSVPRTIALVESLFGRVFGGRNLRRGCGGVRRWR
jgi:hypothetical protein